MMKVQSQPQQPATQTATATGTTGAAKTSDAKSAAAAGAAPANAGQLNSRFKDGFDPSGPIIRDWPPYGPLPLPRKDTLGLGDQLTAGRLPDTLSNPLDKPLLDAGKKDVQLSRDDKGVMRGPDGQPLAKVGLKDGNTAYVDPNTNQYYLTDERDFFGQVNALGPLPLPEGAKFSNSYFSDADVRSIERDAKGGGSIWPPFPHPIDPLPLPPRPFPIDPLPLPRPIPFEPWGPIKPIDPRVLLDAGAGKASGIE